MAGLVSQWRNRGLSRRAERALNRQLDYQRRKSESVRGHEKEYVARMVAHSQAVRKKIEEVRPIAENARVLEVGCGAHGLIFYFGAKDGVGVDPLADHYASLFPAWQGRATIIAAGGEQLPLEDASFDIVLCDNVVDHAESPSRIMSEIARVLKPGGLLYFTVNVHHPFYHAAASAHAAWRALGIPLEIGPFADHTVHLTPEAAKALVRQQPFRLVREDCDIDHARRVGRLARPRHMGDRLKHLFYKNALYEVIAVREG